MNRFICIADDDPKIREIVKIFIETRYQNIFIAEAENGHGVLIKAQTQKFDLIILDLKMPKLNGTSTIKHLFRQRKELIPDNVLVFSGYMGDPEYEECKSQYSHLKNIQYMAKPFDENAFIKYLENVCKFVKKEASKAIETNLSALEKDFVSALEQASSDVLYIMGGIKAWKDRAYLILDEAKFNEFSKGRIWALLPVVGDVIDGSAVICFDRDAFLDIYFQLTRDDIGVINDSNREIAKALSNQIFAFTQSKLKEKGILIKNSEAIVLYGEDAKMEHLSNGKRLRLEMMINNGKFYIELMYTAKNFLKK